MPTKTATTYISEIRTKHFIVGPYDYEGGFH